MPTQRRFLANSTKLQREPFSFQGKAGICVCTSGNATLKLDESSYDLHHGSLYIISPLIPSGRLSASSDFRCIEILDDASTFFPILQSIIETVLQLKSKQVPCLELTQPDMNYFIRQNKLLSLRKKNLESSESQEETKLLRNEIQLIEQETMFETLRLYYRNRQPGVHTVSSNERIVFNFIYAIYKNCQIERSVSHYAREAGLSTGYFSNIVKQLSGKTPSDWISHLTMLSAKKLLGTTSKSIKEIAQELHFPEQFTFSKYFTLYAGISPQKYRERQNES